MTNITYKYACFTKLALIAICLTTALALAMSQTVEIYSEKGVVTKPTKWLMLQPVPYNNSLFIDWRRPGYLGRESIVSEPTNREKTHSIIVP